MPAPSIFHALERGVTSARVSKYDLAYDAVLLGQRYVTTLAMTESFEQFVDEARNYLAERGVHVGFGCAFLDDGGCAVVISGASG